MSLGRVAVIGPNYVDSLESNLARAAQRMGFEAEVLPYLAGQGRGLQRLRRAAARNREAETLLQANFLRHHRREYDLILVLTGAANLLQPSTVSALQRRARHVAAWFVDTAANIRGDAMYRANYDALFFAERNLVRVAKANGLVQAHLLSEGHDIEYHRPPAVLKTCGHVAVVGNYHPLRVRLLDQLARAGIPLQLYGGPLPRHASSLAPLHTGRWIAGPEKAAVFASASAVLNSLHPTHADIANCRIFEATASGGVVVTEGRPLIRELFEDGRDLYIYDDFDVLLARLTQVLEDPDRQSTLRANAVAGARQNTLERRLETILNVLQA